MVGGDRVFSQSFAEMMRHALGQPARVDKNKRGTMLGGKRRDAIVNLVPHFVRCHGPQLAAGNFDGKIEFAAMADLHDFWGDEVCAGQKIGHEFNGLLSCGKANARKTFAGQMIEAFERERQMCPALVVCNGVDFVHDDGLDGPQDLAAPRGGQQDVERFWSRYQNVRRVN